MCTPYLYGPKSTAAAPYKLPKGKIRRAASKNVLRLGVCLEGISSNFVFVHNTGNVGDLGRLRTIKKKKEQIFTWLRGVYCLHSK